MKSNKRIKSYNKKYVKQLDEALRVTEPYLIEAFTNFYGEEYREQIKYTIQNIKYSYFLSQTFFEHLLKLGHNISHHDKKVALYYYQYLKSFGVKSRGIKDSHLLEDEALKVFMVKSYFDKDTLIFNNYLGCISSDQPIYLTLCDEEEKEFYKSIFLPLFVINLKIIIHEINHSFMEDVALITDEDYLVPNLFVNEECEELFNEYITMQVFECYIKLSGFIPYSLKKFEFENESEDYFCLIADFYEIFEQVIKKSIMTKNFNLLYEYAGKKDFDLFCNLVQKYYLQKGCTEEEYDYLNELVLKMNNHALSIKPIHYESYFKELESMGIRVRRLK